MAAERAELKIERFMVGLVRGGEFVQQLERPGEHQAHARVVRSSIGRNCYFGAPRSAMASEVGKLAAALIARVLLDHIDAEVFILRAHLHSHTRTT